MSPKALLSSNLWWDGPPWLREPAESWPPQQDFKEEQLDNWHDTRNSDPLASKVTIELVPVPKTTGRYLQNAKNCIKKSCKMAKRQRFEF